MKNLPFIIFATLIFTSCEKEIKENIIEVKYPETKKNTTVDNIFGIRVIDNYRWLEDDRSKETEYWVKSQNEVTFDYLSKIPYRAK